MEVSGIEKRRTGRLKVGIWSSWCKPASSVAVSTLSPAGDVRAGAKDDAAGID
jgi:hypothetical protein